MPSLIHHMTVIQYFRDGRPWEEHTILSPSWSDVEAAIRRMDNYCFPIVQLNRTENEEDEGIFNIFGGEGRYALAHMMGDWQYADPEGSKAEARLWESDQGYFCEERNILTDIEKVLRITRAFYESGSYEHLDEIA